MDKGKIRIITLPVSSWQEYKELRLRALQKEPLAFYSSYEKEASWSDEKWRQSLQDAIDGDSWLYFASANGKLVGMIGGFGDELDRKNYRVYLWGMYVDGFFRRKGIAYALAKRLLCELNKREKIHVVCLEVNPNQVFAVKLYEGLGFRKVGVETFVIGDGLPHEFTVMEKILRL